MASSRKSNLTDIVAARLLASLPKQGHIVIGLSGGMDSVVLLHALSLLTPRFEYQLSAVHVHHGISPNADAWASFCSKLCADYGIALQVKHVDIAPLKSEHGIEAAARKLRQAVFAEQGSDFVALAHHADDQSETLLLQLLRGSGIKGVAAMPLVKDMGRYTVLRPLLDITRTELLDYAQTHGLRWIEDESNADERYPRNFLRHRLLPLLEEKFPAYRTTLMRSAQHFAEANGLLDELAQRDGAGGFSKEGLKISVLRELSLPRAKNLLRYFFHMRGIAMPQSLQLEEMLQQLLEARSDAAVCIEFAAWQLRRYQDTAYISPALGEFDPAFVMPWQGELELPWPALGQKVAFHFTQGRGLSIAKLQSAPVTVRLRNGGERLRPQAMAATRSLKNLLQEHQIPPWQRERLPLLYCGDELACVVGVEAAAAFRAEASEPGVSISLG